ncbi:hypothetical protein [Sulfitobacter sp. SK011]|uniref:hypothetical protein n=1 Tax=Sulfitobacter sp. SK011 TaxID=1389004 RepID=UPI000E0BEB26|nr:hypothetical protein [Sulfitobacter sp. SK011]AXI40696.1 hypothetical protein C1J02_00990 [Sulfitobacter sp. SK011]
MQWRKLGHLFNPDEWDLGDEIIGFAQGPQALVFDDFIRVFFSTRKRSQNGKFISTIRYADFDESFSRVLRVKKTDIISDGALGAFDEHGIFPMNILRVDDLVYGYTSGWSRKISVDIDMAIGLAISKDDGDSFERTGSGPVLAAGLHEPFLVGDAFVQRFASTYHMWYIFGTKWEKFTPEDPPDRVYKIAHATSRDGINWQRDGRQIITDRLNPDECQALPTVIEVNGRYLMLFCYREAHGFRTDSTRGYRIGAAWSDDLETWERDDMAAIESSAPGAWDSEMLCYPHMFRLMDTVYLLYNGNAFGREGFGIAVLDP